MWHCSIQNIGKDQVSCGSLWHSVSRHGIEKTRFRCGRLEPWRAGLLCSSTSVSDNWCMSISGVQISHLDFIIIACTPLIIMLLAAGQYILVMYHWTISIQYTVVSLSFVEGINIGRHQELNSIYWEWPKMADAPWGACSPWRPTLINMYIHIYDMPDIAHKM